MKELASALVKATAEIGGAVKGKVNPAFKSKYADLGSVIEAVKPALAKHGLTFVQTFQEKAGGVCVETVILHESGESLPTGWLFVPATKQDAQGYGSAITYARRYSLQTAFGVPAEDDDGNAASQPTRKFPTPVESAAVPVADQAKVARVASALVDFHTLMLAGTDTGYQAFETIETLDSDEQIAVWKELAQHSKVRAWIKTVLAEHRKTAA
jgi:hypothetical protein